MATQSVLRSLLIFEKVLETQPARLVDLAQAVDLPKTTVLRNLQTLAEAGWLVASADPTARWSVAPHLQDVMLRGSGTPPLRRIAEPIMQELRRVTMLGLQLATPSDRAQVLVVDSLPVANGPSLSPVGTVLTMTETSAGVAMLARLSDTAASRIVGYDINDQPELIAAVRAAQSTGVATRLHEPNGVTYYSAVVIDSTAASVGALTMANPRGIDDDSIRALADAALQISAALGHHRAG